MTDTEIENIVHLLKTHYGATKVFVDNDLISVYGSDVDAVYVAVVVEYGSEYDVIYERRNEDTKEVVLQLVKKSKKDVDKDK
jgi:hypothetical protein